MTTIPNSPFPIPHPLFPLRVLRASGRAAQAKAFALLSILKAFSERHAVQTLFIHTAARCLSGRPPRGIFLTIFFLLIAVPAFSQSADDIDVLLETETISNQQAAWFVLNAANPDGFSGSPDEAFRYAIERKWLPANAAADGRARLDGVSLLVMQSHNMKGGLMYALTKSGRYAYSELVYLNIIQGRADPQMAVSGDLLLFILTRILLYQEGEL